MQPWFNLVADHPFHHDRRNGRDLCKNHHQLVRHSTPTSRPMTPMEHCHYAEDNMFGWLTKWMKRPAPEARWHVEEGPEVLCVRDAEGQVSALAKAELSGVAIETNDTGPWGADVWWLLFGSCDQLACAFPQGATGEQAAIDYLMALDGFDHGAYHRAMSSTENAIFPVWRRQS
jgi:hypothetical protein